MTKILFLLLLGLSLTSLSLQAQVIAHEWGTFTTLSGSSGQRLSGLTLEEEWLPDFVYQHDDYHPTQRNKGFGLRDLKNVNVKMETPVIYFYTDKKMDVSVRVDFPSGSISQWYPQRSAGEIAPPAGTAIDFAIPHKGWIEWNAEILSKGDQQPYSAPASSLTNTWKAPRETDASLVRCSGSKDIAGEVEKYLFYRGVGNFDLPLKTAFTAEGRLTLTNTGGDAIPYLLVYHQRDSLVLNDEGKVTATIKLASVWWTGELGAKKTVEVEQGREYVIGASNALKTEYEGFIRALEKAGLYTKEAQAMLNTWFQSYFNHSGLRVFWIVPRPLTDKIIPLQINPQPYELERVLVGRSEVLTPQFEKELYEDMVVKKDESKWKEDRYLLAYRERASQLQQTTSAEDNSGGNSLRIYPNPVEKVCALDIRLSQASQIQYQLRNLLGETLLSAQSAPALEHSYQLDMSNLPSGSYYLTVRSAGYEWYRLIVK